MEPFIEFMGTLQNSGFWLVKVYYILLSRILRAFRVRITRPKKWCASSLRGVANSKTRSLKGTGYHMGVCTERCVYIYVYIYIYIYFFVCLFMRLQLYLDLFMYICVFDIFVYVCLYIHMYICIYKSASLSNDQYHAEVYLN